MSTHNFTYLQERLQSGQYRRARTFINKNLEPAQTAHLLETCLPNQRRLVWQLVEEAQRGEVLLFVGDEVRRELIDGMDVSQIITALADLDDDDLADLLQQLPERVIDAYLSQLETVDRQRIESLLSYPEDSAGGLMNPDVISVRPDTTVEVIRRLLRRKEQKEQLAQTECIYVTNTRGRLIGTAPITRLTYADSQVNAAEIMHKQPPFVQVTATTEDIARVFQNQAAVEIAVLGDSNKLLGRITFDDVFDIIREQGQSQRVSFTGGESGELDVYASVRKSLFSRSLWLGINLFTALIASSVIDLFNATIEKLVALAVLMPIVASMGGIAGTQTLTIMIRGFSLGQVSKNKLGWLLRRELQLSAINGIFWALIIGVLASLWFDNLLLGVIIGVALVCNLVMAALAGVCLPALLRSIKIDPAVSGGVIITTFTDVIGFFTFLGLATLIF